jgi:hypothetical protein
MPAVTGDSSTNAAAVTGSNTDGGAGMAATSQDGEGLHAETQSDRLAGVAGFNLHAAFTPTLNPTGVFGKSQVGEGVHGETDSPHYSGVAGLSLHPTFTQGEVPAGVWGKAQVGEGVHGETNSDRFAGVAGLNLSTAQTEGLNPTGVFGKSQVGEGVHGETSSSALAAVAGLSLNPRGTGAGVFGQSSGSGAGVFGRGRVAGFFEGDVVVTGDIRLTGADCAEEFDVTGDAEAGTVVVLDDCGAVTASREPYDRRVAGVVSGAGGVRPGVLLGTRGEDGARLPLALVGKAYCMVDADYASVVVGDLLTTSATPGHAMRATDRERAFGAILGKALRPLATGRALVPILVALQ